MNEELRMEQIQRELNIFGLNKSAKDIPDALFVEFKPELDKIEAVLSKWIAKDGKAEHLGRQDPKLNKQYSGELFDKIKLDKLSKVILSGLFNAVIDIHEQPNGKSDNGNPHFQMIIHNNMLMRYLPILGFQYKSDVYPLKNRLTFWTKIIHNILLETESTFCLYKGEDKAKKDSGYWLIKLTDSADTRLKPFNPTLRFPLNNPMLVQPDPYTSPTTGGYLTNEMQSVAPLSRHHEHIPQPVLDAVNRAQAVAFTVNIRGIESMEKLITSRKHKLKELKAKSKVIKGNLATLFEEKAKYEHSEAI